MNSILFLVICTAFSAIATNQLVQLETSFEVAEGLQTKTEIHDIPKENAATPALYFLAEERFAPHLKTRTPYQTQSFGEIVGANIGSLADAMLYGLLDGQTYYNTKTDYNNKPYIATCTFGGSVCTITTSAYYFVCSLLTSCPQRRIMDNSILPTKVAQVTVAPSTTVLQLV